MVEEEQKEKRSGSSEDPVDGEDAALVADPAVGGTVVGGAVEVVVEVVCDVISEILDPD